MSQLSIQLPNLEEYRQEFVAKGVQIPLAKVPVSQQGLLAELPTPPDEKTGWPWTVETQPPPATMANGLPWPKISIVTPSYNQSEFIEETIRSVLLQNYPNIEYVICDGGSNDGTKEILEKYSPWLSYWQSEKDRGQAHAINLGFSLCRGKYFGWVNSDDLYLPDCFCKLAIHVYQKNYPEFVYGDAINLYQDENKLIYVPGQLVLERYFQFGGLIASHAAFWKSEIHVPIWEEMKCNVDGELWFRLIAGRSKSHLKAALGVFRVQPEAKTNHERYLDLWQEDDIKIWSVHGHPPKHNSFLTYEYHLVQKLYRMIHKPFRRSQYNLVLKQCSW